MPQDQQSGCRHRHHHCYHRALPLLLLTLSTTSYGFIPQHPTRIGRSSSTQITPGVPWKHHDHYYHQGVVVHANEFEYAIPTSPLMDTTMPTALQKRRASSAQVINDFLAWLDSHGVDLSKVELRRSEEDGFGLYAAQDIPPQEAFINLPHHLILRPSSPPWAHTETKEDLLQSLSPTSRLALRVLVEKSLGRDSKFAPYIKMLPEREDLHSPLLWEDEELALLSSGTTPSDYYMQMYEMKTMMEADQETVMTTLERWGEDLLQHEGGARVLLAGEVEKQKALMMAVVEEWDWAWAVATSRAYSTDGSPSLIPMVDMLNHNDRVTYGLRRVKGNPGSVRYITDRLVSKGSQLYGTYGLLSPYQKLFQFGYLDGFTQGATLLRVMGEEVEVISAVGEDGSIRVAVVVELVKMVRSKVGSMGDAVEVVLRACREREKEVRKMLQVVDGSSRPLLVSMDRAHRRDLVRVLYMGEIATLQALVKQVQRPGGFLD